MCRIVLKNASIRFSTSVAKPIGLILFEFDLLEQVLIMLTRKQLQISFFAFNIFTKIGFYPFALNFKSGEIRREKCTIKWFFWWILLAFTASRALMATIRILIVFGSHLEVPIRELTIMMCQLLYWPAVYCFTSLFYNNLDLTLSSFNYLLQSKYTCSVSPRLTFFS